MHSEKQKWSLEQVLHSSKCKVFFVGTIAPSHHCEHMESLNKQGHSELPTPCVIW